MHLNRPKWQLAAEHYKQNKIRDNMIKYISGDILQSKDEYIAQGVAVGSQEGLGTGLAFKLSSQFPEIQKLFKKYTRNAKFQAGDVFIGEISGSSPGIIYIATQPDMYHAELTYLNKGLKRLKKICASKGIKTVSLPKIGAGLGKLDWNNEVKPLLESILSDSETVFNVYEDYKIEYEN